MTADSEKNIQFLKAIGRVCAETLRRMMAQVRAGMTTRELDEIGRAILEAEGAHSAPNLTYNFPGATCISVSPVVSKHERHLEKLLEATKATLAKALRAAKAGNLLNGIGRTVQNEARKRGYNVIYDLTGHGIGRKLHESPRDILNYYNPADRTLLNEGLVLAIEPFLTTGVGRVIEERDGWSLRTSDRAVAAQFEHTIVVTKNEPLILTLCR